MRSILFAVCSCLLSSSAIGEERPNVLWITSEDHGPHLGCYGDEFATTPHVDALAARGMRYKTCWSNSPVCAAARTTLIMGVYASSTGGQHMRSMVPMPEGIKMYPAYLRDAGYFCTNNAKEDYNLKKPAGTWDESSNKAHWRARKEGQPFFAIFNSTKSHESQIRTRPHTWQHDPEKVRVPAYHPDTKETREDWAQYYDQVSAADADAGKVLAQLKEDGLAEETIVFYFADHGSGMPRNKRSACNSGLHVPLVVYFPEKFQHLAPPEYKPGGVSERVVSFVDFAPTLLSICGVKPPEHMQGRAFAGPFHQEGRGFAFGLRDRMDERYDLMRSVTDGRYVYVRNYLPHLPAGQHISYMFQTPTTKVWKKLFDEGKATPAQAAFWQKKPAEELYDLQNDPDEVQNLVASEEHFQVLQKLRAAHVGHVRTVRDVGLLPESEMFERSQGKSPYDMGHDMAAYHMPAIHQMAWLASGPDADAVARLTKALAHDDAAVRYWGAMGLMMREGEAVAAGREELRKALNDKAPCVRIAAAEALVRYGQAEDASPALAALLELANAEKSGALVSIAGLNALDNLGERAAPISADLLKLPEKGPSPAPRYLEYPPRLLESLRGRFE